MSVVQHEHLDRGLLGHDEQLALDAHEAVIARGLQTFVEVGTALADIAERRLYRGTHTTFEDYCRSRWGFSDRRARQMIAAASVVGVLPPGTTVPVNEGQARGLSGLDPEVAARVMSEAARSGRVTAAGIREARRVVAPRPDGKQIEISVQEAEARTTEIKQKLHEIVEAYTEVISMLLVNRVPARRIVGALLDAQQAALSTGDPDRFGFLLVGVFHPLMKLLTNPTDPTTDEAWRPEWQQDALLPESEVESILEQLASLGGTR